MGHSPHVDHAWISTALAIRRPLYPNLKVRLTTGFALDLIRNVLAGELNFALVLSPPETSQITAVPFARTPLYAALPETHPAAGKEGLMLRDLASDKWILCAKQVHPEVRDAILETAERESIDPEVAHDIFTAQQAFYLVSEHMGIAILTDPAALGFKANGVVIRPMAEESLWFETCLVMRANDDSRPVNEFARYDLLKFTGFLRDEKNQSPRSVYNKFETVMGFLKANGIRGLVGKNDWPRYTEEEPEMYEQEELDTLFKACTEEEQLWYEFFLMTGMREQEVMHTYWSDINFTANTVRVSHKPDRNWTPKAYKEREIPIPARLAKKLKAWKAKADKNCFLVFPTAGCNPKLDFLDCLKACAERAELNKEDFWLHKFRSTFATRCLWAGVDLRTVQQWLGHSDMESTMRYLKPSRNQAVQEKVNDIFA
jgi:integrase